MLRAILISLAVILALPVTAMAEVTAADLKAIDTKVDIFFKTANQGKTTEAFTAFMLPETANEPDLISQLAGTMDQLRTYYEVPFEYDLIKTTTAGNRLVVRDYIIYTDKVPYFIRVSMFKTSTGWFGQYVTMKDLKPEDIVGN